MAISPLYAVRETAQNLWRNILLTSATVITIGVSLWLFGGFFLFNYAVSNATARWEGGIEFVVWMNPDATPAQDAAIQTALKESPEIKDWTYVNQQQAYEEFKVMFADTPEVVAAVPAESLPPSYRVVPADPNADMVRELSEQFNGRPGVWKVVSADETIRAIQTQADKIGIVFFIGSIILLGAATLLILTNIVSAIKSRGEEIEIMKVVGATNWFIRIPFMIEGLSQAILGALGAWAGLWALDNWVISGFNDTNSLALLDGFQVTSSEFMQTSIMILGIAVLVSVIGSAVAISRYLDA